jgi:creatinine amidohydrolase
MTGPATTIRPAQPSVVTPSSAPPIGALLADLTWPEVEARLARGAAAVLPLGAACKEHGRHLPMGADALQAEWLSRRLAERADVLVWPVLSYGHYPAFIDYPGSCSLSPETFRSLVREILQDILRHGTRLAVVLNTGISTIAPLERAAADLPARDRVVLMHV